MPERYNSLPRLKLEPNEDPMQQGDAPMSAPARSTGLLDLAAASPHGHSRPTGVHHPGIQDPLCVISLELHHSFSSSRNALKLLRKLLQLRSRTLRQS